MGELPLGLSPHRAARAEPCFPFPRPDLQMTLICGHTMTTDRCRAAAQGLQGLRQHPPAVGSGPRPDVEAAQEPTVWPVVPLPAGGQPHAHSLFPAVRTVS